MLLDLDDVKLHFVEWLYLKDHELIDILLGSVIANLFQGPDSLNLDLVGPPSSTKTELLRSLSKYPVVYTLSTLTPQTLISGARNPGSSLLLKLNADGKRILVIKDLTSILQMRSESRQEILSQLREIADGYISKPFGTGRRVEWSGKLGVLAGVTPVIDEHHGHNQILGERFLYCRVSNDNPKAMAERARKMAGKEIGMRQQLQEITKQFLEQFKDPKIEKIHISEHMEKKLIALACFVAIARTGVSRDRYHRTVEYMPEAEGPARLTKQIWILGAGISTVQGKEELDGGVYGILKRVAMNSLPRHRSLLIRAMWETSIMGGEWEPSKVIGKLINTPTETAKRYLEDLWMLNLLNRRIEGEEEDEESWKTKKTPYSWQLSKECIQLIEQSEVFLPKDQANLPKEPEINDSFSPQNTKEKEKEKNIEGLA